MNPNDYQQNQPVVIPAPQGSQQQNQAGGANYSFSAEELKVLKECNLESFYQRSLPLGVSLGVGTFLAVQKGILKPTGTYGAFPKVMLAGVVGYFLGKFSYQQKCAEKIMRLPNSRLAEALRRRKRGEFFENINPDGGLSLAPFSSNTDVYTDESLKPNTNSLDLDISRPFNSGLDDTYRPNIDTPEREFNDNLPTEAPQTTTTYEELRRKNREEYEKKTQNPYYKPVNPEEAPIVRRSVQKEAADDFATGPKNKYGDVMLK